MSRAKIIQDFIAPGFIYIPLLKHFQAKNSGQEKN
jgi:hypothetical protein